MARKPNAGNANQTCVGERPRPKPDRRPDPFTKPGGKTPKKPSHLDDCANSSFSRHALIQTPPLWLLCYHKISPLFAAHHRHCIGETSVCVGGLPRPPLLRQYRDWPSLVRDIHRRQIKFVGRERLRHADVLNGCQPFSYPHPSASRPGTSATPCRPREGHRLERILTAGHPMQSPT